MLYHCGNLQLQTGIWADTGIWVGPNSAVCLGDPCHVGSGCFPDTIFLSHSITVKDLKAMLPQVNYRVPNMRFLRDKLVVSPWLCGEWGFKPLSNVSAPVPFSHHPSHRRWKPGMR